MGKDAGFWGGCVMPGVPVLAASPAWQSVEGRRSTERESQREGRDNRKP